MTQAEKRCLRAVSNQLDQVQRDILWAALAEEISPHARAEMVATLRAATERLERGND